MQFLLQGEPERGKSKASSQTASFVPVYLSLRIGISLPVFPRGLWFMAREAVYSLVREESINYLFSNVLGWGDKVL